VRHVRMLGLCLVAALALGAYAVSSASALEWGQCVKMETATFQYSGPNCNAHAGEKAKPKGTGEYEWRKVEEIEASRRSFAGEGGTGILLGEYRICEPSQEKKPKCAEGEEVEELYAEVECTHELNQGEINGKNTIGNIGVIFYGCVALGSLECSNTGLPGEVQVTALKGKLGWINKTNKEVGVLLTPEAKHGLFAKFSCGEGLITTYVGVGSSKEGTWYKGPLGEEKHGGYDGIISPIVPVNEMTTSFTQEFTFNEQAENIPSSFEGKHIDLLESWIEGNSPGADSQWSPSAEAITNVNHGCHEKASLFHCNSAYEAAEIKA
jgi:hypothetical protein